MQNDNKLETETEPGNIPADIGHGGSFSCAGEYIQHIVPNTGKLTWIRNVLSDAHNVNSRPVLWKAIPS